MKYSYEKYSPWMSKCPTWFLNAVLSVMFAWALCFHFFMRVILFMGFDFDKKISRLPMWAKEALVNFIFTPIEWGIFKRSFISFYFGICSRCGGEIYKTIVYTENSSKEFKECFQYRVLKDKGFSCRKCNQKFTTVNIFKTKEDMDFDFKRIHSKVVSESN